MTGVAKAESEHRIFFTSAASTVQKPLISFTKVQGRLKEQAPERPTASYIIRQL